LGIVRIQRGDVRGLDELSVDALCLPLYQVIKQPMSVAGCADWRMCGRIAKLLLTQRFKGEEGERLLTPSQGRLGAEVLFLFGLGEPRELQEAEVAKRAQDIIEVVVQAKVKKFAVAAPELPGRVAPPPSGRDDRSDRKAPLFAMTPALRLLASLVVLAGGKESIEELVLLDADMSLHRADQFFQQAAKRGGMVYRT
jgi:hypothetical protein